MIKEVFEVELADGTRLEVKFRNRWFDNLRVTDKFQGIIAATRLEDGKSVLRFLFAHRSYFQLFGDLRLPLLFMPLAANYDKFEESILEVLRWYKEQASVEFEMMSKKIFPVIGEVLLRPVMERIEELEDKLKASPEADRERFVRDLTSNYIIEAQKASKDERAIREFVKRYASPELVSDATKMTRNISGLIFQAMVESGLKRLRLMLRVMCDDDLGTYNRIVKILTRCGIVSPFLSTSLCPNENCMHFELLFSDSVPRAKCSKCERDAFLMTFTLIDEVFSWLKERMLDPVAFLYCYIASKSSPQYIEGDFIPDIQCFPDVYVRNIETGKERQIDALLYSPMNKKAIAIESKIHEITEELTFERLRKIATDDLKQLVEILDETGIRRGGYVTNLKIQNNDLKSIQERTIAQLIKDLRIDEVEVFSMTSGEDFLKNVDKVIDSLRSSNPETATYYS